MSVPILGQSTTPKKEEQIRLLICLDCKSIEELPDYEGDPQYDVLLEIAAQAHEDVTGNRHSGHLMKVPVKFWSKPDAREAILGQIREGAGGIDDVDKGFYDTKSTFAEDAMACFNKHLRPAGRCPDWKADSKVLVPKTNAARKDLGLTPVEKAPGPKTYLCQFCPASIFMNTQLRQLRGQYK